MALNDINGAVDSFKKALELEPNDGKKIFHVLTFSFYVVPNFS